MITPIIIDDIIPIETLHNYIDMAYSIDNYIDYIPTIKTYISDSLSKRNIEDIIIGRVPKKIRKFWDETGFTKCFFRLNMASPKDVSNCLVASPLDIIRLIKLSDRCRYFIVNPDFEIKIVLREWIVDYPTEFRLFVHDSKLRAISQNDNTNFTGNKKIIILKF
jgi:hypothetical protein